MQSPAYLGGSLTTPHTSAIGNDALLLPFCVNRMLLAHKPLSRPDNAHDYDPSLTRGHNAINVKSIAAVWALTWIASKGVSSSIPSSAKPGDAS